LFFAAAMLLAPDLSARLFSLRLGEILLSWVCHEHLLSGSLSGIADIAGTVYLGPRGCRG